MQENNFEKQVQQKMEELSLSPSAEVWQKLSVNIAKDQRRRRFFIILLLLLLMIGSAVYLVFNNPSNKEFQIASSKKNISDKIKNSGNLVIENKANKIINDTSSTENAVKDLIATGDQQPAALSLQNEAATGKPNATVVKHSVSFSRKNINGDKNNLNALALDKAKKSLYKTRQQLIVLVSENAPLNLINDDSSATVVDNRVEIADRKVIKMAPPINDVVTELSRYEIVRADATISVVQLSNSFVQMLTNTNKKEFDTATKTTLSKRKGWDFGFNFSVGAATTQAGLLGVIGPGSGDGSKVASDMTQNNPGGVTPGTPVVYAPSRVKTGAGIVMGGFAQKALSSRSSFVLGLNFKVLNSSMMTGARVDSTAFFSSNSISSSNFYYRNGSQRKFRNHFYFIEFPVSIKLQLNKQKKVPVYLTTGINVTRLIGSNALQFDVSSGTYYQNNTFLNKTQWSGTLGILFLLNAKTKNPLLLGPDIQYGFNKMADAGLYKNRHYSFIGLRLMKTIGKK